MKPTVAVILLQGDTCTSDVQSVLETAASALQEASMKMSEAAGSQPETPQNSTSAPNAKKRSSNQDDKIPMKHVKIAGERVDIVNQTSPSPTLGDQKPKLLKDLRVVDLKSELGKRGLATTGLTLKTHLADRLKKDLQEKGQNIDTFNFNERNINLNESNKTGNDDKKIPIEKACDVKEEKPSKLTDNQPSTSNLERDGNQNGDPCPVCFDKPLYPLKLPCDHIYCFLCAKGLCESNLTGGGGLCGMCRRPFSREIFKQSKHHVSSSKTIENSQDICWFYEGKCGWWKFDERNGEEIEQSFNTGVEKFQLLLCGKLYVIDFKNMIQYRVDGSGRVRCIKRDSASSSSKGIAGLTNKN